MTTPACPGAQDPADAGKLMVLAKVVLPAGAQKTLEGGDRWESCGAHGGCKGPAAVPSAPRELGAASWLATQRCESQPLQACLLTLCWGCHGALPRPLQED